MKRTCKYKFKSGEKCPRTVYKEHLCGGHYRRKVDGADMEELATKPLRKSRRVADDKVMERLDKLASVMGLSRKQLVARIVGDWIRDLTGGAS